MTSILPRPLPAADPHHGSTANSSTAYGSTAPGSRANRSGANGSGTNGSGTNGSGANVRLAYSLRRFAPLLPALATVLLLAAPVSTGDVSTSGKVTPADAASAVLVLACAVRLLRHRARPLTAAAAVVLGAPSIGFALSAMTSLDPGAGLAGFLRYVQVFVLVPAALVLLLRDRRDFAVVAGAIVVLSLVQGAVGVWQFATATGASYMGEDIRAVGTFGPSDIMGMATVVAYGLVICVGCALAPAAPGAPRRLRTAALCCAAALLVPLAVSFSRGTWIATGVACAVLIVLAGGRRAVRIFAVLVAGGVLLVGGLGVGSALISERAASITQVKDAPDPSVTDRYTLWAAAIAMWREHPATGVGLKRFPEERDGHASLALSAGSDTAGAGQSFAREPLLSPHNMYLLALSEQGLIGFTLLIGGWAAILACGTQRLWRWRTAAGRGGGPEGGPGDRHEDRHEGGRRDGTAGVGGVGDGGAGVDRVGLGGTGLGGGIACGLVAVGLLLWQCVDFLYADIGGPTTVLSGTLIGLAGWWALHSANGRAQ